MDAQRKDLVAEEGVEQGSAPATVEGQGSGTSGDVVAGGTRPPGGDDVAAPVEVDAADLDREGPGQQLEAGEG